MRLNQLKKIGINAIFLRQFLDSEESGLGVKNFLRVQENIEDVTNALKFINDAHKKGKI